MNDHDLFVGKLAANLVCVSNDFRRLEELPVTNVGTYQYQPNARLYTKHLRADESIYVSDLNMFFEKDTIFYAFYSRSYGSGIPYCLSYTKDLP